MIKMKSDEAKKKTLFPRGKKAVNDVSIIAVILFIFIGTAIFIVFIDSEFGTTSSKFDIDNVQDEFIDETFTDTSDISTGNILKSIGKMFFWTFGDLPFWLDMIFVVIRIILLFILIRNFTPFLGGGA